MKTVLLLILSLMAITNAPVNKFPKGAYMSFDELKNRTPSVQCELKMQEVSEEDMDAVPTNRFLFSSPEKCLSQGKIDSKMWGYSDGNSLYLNCALLKLNTGFAQVLTEGRYLVFYQNEFTDKMYTAQQWRVSQHVDEKTQRSLCVVDMDEAKLYHADSTYMAGITQAHPDVVAKYKGVLMHDDSLVVKYFATINEKK